MKSFLVIYLALLILATSTDKNLQTGDTVMAMHKNLNDKCKNWNQQKNQCIECYQGCTKWENICVKIVKYCAKWDDQGNCVQCQPGYGSDTGMSINGTCPQQQNTTLTSPPPNNQTIDTNCQCHDDNRTCIYCYAGYYLDLENFCVELPENCTAADPFGNCTSCIAGFKVENGQCVKQQCDLSLCATFNADQTQCASCPLRSYLQNGCCIQVNGYCQQYVQSTGVCTKCYTGYVINKNNNKECILANPQ